MNIYRRIYEEKVGPIPIDQDGRTFEIHHIDGNHENNDIDNLLCITIQEHYNIHFSQGDYSACMLIANRMLTSPVEISALSSLFNRQRVENKTHNFLGSSLQNKRVENGSHPFLGGKIQGASSRSRVNAKTHNFIGGIIQQTTSQRRITEGTHNCLTHYTCPHCKKQGKGPVMLRHHFDNCKVA